ncbi:DUF2752 domain-containing protein [Novipirellula caenicola]|uniref:DUF2752 domain-containing protein n=1 Tax=Novipirellula caenicola TaxID=1536901 RepID=A0ABP9VYZ1_9BACT
MLVKRGLLRGFSLLVGIVPFALLVTASQLSPSEQGLGTHQQLGLPPCSSRILFGIRCPACGMTTSWAHFTQGHWWQSVQANVGGFLLAMVACWVVLLSAAVFVNPRVDVMRYQKTAAIAAIGIGLITLCDWLFRLYR